MAQLHPIKKFIFLIYCVRKTIKEYRPLYIYIKEKEDNIKNVQPREKAKKEILKNVPSLVSRLDINSAIINCEDIINSRLGRKTVEAG